MKDPNRTALLVRCSEEEARFIREAAQREHRTLSGYILNIVMSRVPQNEGLLSELPNPSKPRR
jgi:uncharacterized protein (DUF1778 family)